MSPGPFGEPPTYSTSRTLHLRLACLPLAAALFGAGVLDHTRAGYYVGLSSMVAGGLVLVYGILTVIRYAEARDALHDPLPRAAMYDTEHQGLSALIGVGLCVGAAALSLWWAAHGVWPLLNVGVGGLCLIVCGLALRAHWATRPG